MKTTDVEPSLVGRLTGCSVGRLTDRLTDLQVDLQVVRSSDHSAGC